MGVARFSSQVLVLLLFLAVAVPTMALQQVARLQASQSAESITHFSHSPQTQTLSYPKQVSLMCFWWAVEQVVGQAQPVAVAVAVVA
jgi:hypothetical protein